MPDPIIAVSSQYVLRRHLVEIVDIGWTRVIPINSNRWSLRFVMGRFGSCWVSPFNDNSSAPGIKLDAGEEKDLYLSREPALVGLAWYAFFEFLPVPTGWIEVWENTPVGT